MGIPVLILGESGSGKSTSLRNFDESEVGIFNVASKPLPFRKKLMLINKATYPLIQKTLAKATLKKYVIDDSQYLMCFEMFGKINEKGYDKFSTCAKNFYDLIQFVINNTPDDCIVYFLHHIDRADDGRIKAKTQGKMLDNQLTVEGLFSIVLLATTDGRNHNFVTTSDGTSPAKAPLDMFPDVIDNDLKMVDDTIRNYYGFDETMNNFFEDRKEGTEE